MPDRDTVHLRRQGPGPGGNDGEGDGSETAPLGPPKRKRLRDHRSTVIDLRGGRPRGRKTKPDLGVTMMTDMRGDTGSDEAPAPAPGRRRLLLIAVLVAASALVVSLLAAYGRDADGAVGGECVYEADEAAIVPGDGWKAQPCALPSPAGERYLVLLRIEGAEEADACAEHLSSWGAEDEREAAVGTDARPAVLCVVPLN